MARIYRGAQERLFNLWQRPAETVVAHGPFRAGKTSAALDGWLMYVLMRGGLFLMASPKLKQVQHALTAQIRESVPGVVTRGGLGGEISMNGGAEGGGSTILCHSAAAGFEGILSLTLNGVFLDEASNMEKTFYDTCVSRCLTTNGKVVLTTNPDGPGHWIKEHILDVADGERYEDHSFTIDDNPALDGAQKERLKRTLTGVWLRRNYYGEWVNAEGAVYPTAGDCVGKPPEGSTPVAVWLGGDFGDTDPTHFIRIEEHEGGKRYITREWRWARSDGGHKTNDEKAQGILAKLGGGEIHAIYVDPSAAGLIETMKRYTPVPVLGAENAVLTGIQQTQAMFELGKLLIDKESCPATYADLVRYAWDAKAMLRGMTKPEHEFSHGADAVRYFCASTLAEEWWQDAMW